MNESEDASSSSSSSSVVEEQQQQQDRSLSVRGIIPALHHVRDSESDLLKIGSLISRFAKDPEPSVRAELAEQLPPIACFCLSPSNRVPESMCNITLPILEQLLTDGNSQVRRITQNSLAFMLEKRLVDFTFVEEKISPVLVHLMDITSVDDYRIEAITTVSKIVRFLGKSVTEKVFLQHFSRLCSDVSFHVRRACASNFGEICSVIGQDLTEAVLLPHFKALCEDVIWGVRKACADVFVPVSCVCSNETRQNILTSLFVSLLCDQSKWVKMAAFQSLGPFISTFADPAKTGLYYTDGGLIVSEDGKDQESNSSGSTDSGCSTDSQHSNEEAATFCVDPSSPSSSCKTATSLLPSYVSSLSLDERNPSTAKMLVVSQKGAVTTIASASTTAVATVSAILPSIIADQPIRRRARHEEEAFFRSKFSSFQFWRIPLTDPSFDPEISCIDIGAAAVSAFGMISRGEQEHEEEEDVMVVDPPPSSSCPEDDCKGRICVQAYYNSRPADQQQQEEEEEGSSSRSEQQNNNAKHRESGILEGKEESNQNSLREVQSFEFGQENERADATVANSIADLSSPTGPGDEAEMRDDEIEDDASQCISSSFTAATANQADPAAPPPPHPILSISVNQDNEVALSESTGEDHDEEMKSSSPSSCWIRCLICRSDHVTSDKSIYCSLDCIRNHVKNATMIRHAADPEKKSPDSIPTAALYPLFDAFDAADVLGTSRKIQDVAEKKLFHFLVFNPGYALDPDLKVEMTSSLSDGKTITTSTDEEPESMDQEECETEIVTVDNMLVLDPEAHNCDNAAKSTVTKTMTTPVEKRKRSFLSSFFHVPQQPQESLQQQQQQQQHQQHPEQLQRQDSREEPSALSAVMSGANYQRILNQESIPSDLLKHFLSMTSPVNYETVDHELSHYCAYSFPAVAMTLGRKHWPCLMGTYESLAADVQWKVRLTLASSLHQMALILGPRYTSRDLIPIFFQFMTDLDEVRFGILQNLSSILRLLNRNEQLSILPRIVDFLRMDNPRNWRFRRTLAEQVVTIAPLFSPNEIKEHLLPIAYTLLRDKVSDVRLSAIHLLSTLMRHFFCDTSLPLRHTPPPPFPAANTSSTLSSDQQHGCFNINNNNSNNNNNNTSSGSPSQRQASGSMDPVLHRSNDRQQSSSSLTTALNTSSMAATKSNARLPLDQVSLELISELTGLVHSNKWVFRQAFVFLCEQMMTDQSLPVQVFNDHFFACLMSLKDDRVSNVRLALSRCLQRSIHGNVMFYEQQEDVIMQLMEFAKDPDSDVRRFARLVVDPYPAAVNATYLEMMAEYESMSEQQPGSCDDQQQHHHRHHQNAEDVFLTGNNHNNNNISSGEHTGSPSVDSSSSSSWWSNARLSLIPQMSREVGSSYPQPPPPPFPSSIIRESTTTTAASVAQVLPEEESAFEAEPESLVKVDQQSSIILNRAVDSRNNVKITVDSAIES